MNLLCIIMECNASCFTQVEFVGIWVKLYSNWKFHSDFVFLVNFILFLFSRGHSNFSICAGHSNHILLMPLGIKNCSPYLRRNHRSWVIFSWECKSTRTLKQSQREGKKTVYKIISCLHCVAVIPGKQSTEGHVHSKCSIRCSGDSFVLAVVQTR